MNRSSSMSVTTQHHNTQRRIFRGRGGATDRNNLPVARRRRPHHESRSTNDTTRNHSNNNDNNNNQNEPDNDDDDHDHDMDLEVYPLEIIEPFVTPQIANESTPPIIDPVVIGEEPEDRHDDDESLLLLLRQELQHITRRMQQLRRNWSTSQAGLVLPSNYAIHVLQATLNVIQKEWLSILRRYYYFDHGETMTRSDTVVATAAVAVSREKLLRPVSHDLFALIQQSIQCGPLTGSQAGYFKRCGSHMAQMVYDYLTTILPTTGDDQPVDRRKVVHNNRHEGDHDDDSQEEDDDDGDDDENDNAEAVSNIDATTLLQRQQQTDGHQQDEQLQQQQNSSQNDVIPTATWFFTDSQIKMIQTWKRNAYKAAVIHPKAAPSKSMMHQEYQAQKIQNEKKRIKARKGR